MKPNVPKLVVAIGASLYFFSIAYDPMADGIWNFLNLVDLPIHETGHLIFRLPGEFMMVAGGSLFQIIFPAVFVGYFFWQKKPFSAAIVFFWVGQSILNVWVYANDAIVMRLVLTGGFTGGEGSFHDWNYLLTRTGLIGSTALIAGLIRVAGTLVIISAAAYSIYLAFAGDEETESRL